MAYYNGGEDGVGAENSTLLCRTPTGRQALQGSEADQFSSLLIPKAKRQGFEAGEQRYWFNGLKQRLRVVAPLQVVIRDPRAQVVNVVEADVAREPLQDLGELVERTAPQGRSARAAKRRAVSVR